ncbi:Lipoprotein [Salinibacterium sp. NYA9b]
MRRFQRSAAAVSVLAIAVLLAGCSYVNRVAARLNAEGSLDFATCDARNTDSFDVEWIGPDGEPVGDPTSASVVGNVTTGDVFHLDAHTPTAEWESVSVRSEGLPGEGNIAGYFGAGDLASGDWVWNQTAIFIGTVDVEHCALNEDSAR